MGLARVDGTPGSSRFTGTQISGSLSVSLLVGGEPFWLFSESTTGGSTGGCTGGCTGGWTPCPPLPGGFVGTLVGGWSTGLFGVVGGGVVSFIGVVGVWVGTGSFLVGPSGLPYSWLPFVLGSYYSYDESPHPICYLSSLGCEKFSWLIYLL